MPKLTALGRLTAAEDRTLKGMLLPYGVPGLTNLGKVTAGPGSVTIPQALAALHASLDHLDDRDSVAEFAVISETDAGLMAEWTVPKTHGGDRLLAEFSAGIRTGISVELEPVEIRGGRIVSGKLIGCAFPVEPAFPTARLVAERTEAPDTDEETEQEQDEEPGEATSDTPQTPEAAPAAPVEPAETTDATPADEEEETPPMTASAQAPADLMLTASRNPSALSRESIKTPGDFYRLMAAAHAGRNSKLFAALADIVPADITDRELPQWVGELWSGNAYQRRIVPLLNQAELTSLELKGWKWTTKPAMARYTGNKTDVPSNPVATEPASGEAIRFAGAHDIDRKYKDFNDTAFFEAYYAAMSESYAKLTDAYALEVLKESAPVVTMGSVPTGVPVGWVAILDGVLSIIDVGTPGFALVEKTVWRDMVLTGTDKFFEFLNAQLSFEEGTMNTGNFKILPVASSAAGDASSAVGLDRGEVLVGARQAITFHELGGGAPIRVEAIDMAKGGVDEGAFGYAGTVVHEDAALALIDTDADGA